MKKQELLGVVAVLLVLLGAYMIYLGTKAGILPPTLTGVGFIIIAFAFFSMRK
jgi:uncharacterized membrane protein YbaN (DUF454 family)